VINNLPSLSPRGSKSQAVNNVVQPSLKQNEQLCTGHALSGGGPLKGVTELGLKESIGPLYLLLLTKLNLVVGESLATTSMLTWTTLALLNSALPGKTPLALEEELLSLSTA
jgi:hypothetical protein